MCKVFCLLDVFCSISLPFYSSWKNTKMQCTSSLFSTQIFASLSLFSSLCVEVWLLCCLFGNLFNIALAFTCNTDLWWVMVRKSCTQWIYPLWKAMKIFTVYSAHWNAIQAHTWGTAEEVDDDDDNGTAEKKIICFSATKCWQHNVCLLELVWYV